jgi:hypothetical protein
MNLFSMGLASVFLNIIPLFVLWLPQLWAGILVSTIICTIALPILVKVRDAASYAIENRTPIDGAVAFIGGFIQKAGRSVIKGVLAVVTFGAVLGLLPWIVIKIFQNDSFTFKEQCLWSLAAFVVIGSVVAVFTILIVRLSKTLMVGEDTD